jgi:hypothetical protein
MVKSLTIYRFMYYELEVITYRVQQICVIRVLRVGVFY